MEPIMQPSKTDKKKSQKPGCDKHVASQINKAKEEEASSNIINQGCQHLGAGVNQLNPQALCKKE